MVVTSKQLFFIALLPPEEVQQKANEIKEHFSQVYNSKAALKSPPHVTLQPPFKWELEKLAILEEKLQEFAINQVSIPMILDGFGAFKPRVIYINVLKTPELMAVQKQLMKDLELSLNLVDPVSKTRPFSPHLTVGFRDLTKENFYKAWSEFKEGKFYFQFTIPKLTLLIHNGKRWEIQNEFDFLTNIN